jgi:hypothetical protein
MPKNVIVITHRSWLAKEVIDAAERIGWVGRQDYGFDVPNLENTSAIWMPTAHAARLYEMGIALPLVCPPEDWMSKLPKKYKSRNVTTTTLGELRLNPNPKNGFAKLTNVKTDNIPAQWYENIQDFINLLEQNNVPFNTSVQISDTKLNFYLEYRMLIQDCKVGSYSQYAPEEPIENTGHIENTCIRMATEVAEKMKDYSPKTYMMDIGFTLDPKNGQVSPAVVEVNNTWSSNLYNIDPDEFIFALEKALDDSSSFQFKPDPYDSQIANKKQPLKYGADLA